MANYHAIAATTDAIVRLLRDNWPADLLENADPNFRVNLATDFGVSFGEGVSLFLYQVGYDAATRNRPPVTRDGGFGGVVLDLHFLLTAWGESAARQQSIAGWMVKVMNDVPVLEGSQLNRFQDGVFGPDEAITVTASDLSTEDLLRIWRSTSGSDLGYQLSVGFVARPVRIG